MKSIIETLLADALEALQAKGELPATHDVKQHIKIDHTKDKKHGDFATNVALALAKPSGMKPTVLAQNIIEAMQTHTLIVHVEIAGPGFINFFMDKQARATTILEQILEQGERFGQLTLGGGKRVLLEYVSANPTGPLHVGHGRGAAFGASLANLLETAGFDVTREYYVNDAGRQMNILALSVWLRYLALSGEAIEFPSNAYQGEYVTEIAQALYQQYGTEYVRPWREVVHQVTPDEPAGGDKEAHVDDLIHATQQQLGQDGFAVFHQAALNAVLTDIQHDLAAFDVTFDHWFSERSLLQSGAIERGIQALTDAGYTFEREGALWFQSTAFGDEKDRVLVRANGEPTYFASDVAYHFEKYQRGFDEVIDLFGADHHGYIARLKAAMKALGHDETALKVFMVQFAILYRNGQRVQMSTRSGSFVTLRELREEVGKDAARFFYVMRKPEQHMDFDLDLAKSESKDNPVYYIQYAHARISSVFRQLAARDLVYDEALGLAHVSLLTEPHEEQLIAQLTQYPEVIEQAAKAYEPHQIAYYLRELSSHVHAYYNAIALLCEDENLRMARLTLIAAVGNVLRNGLKLLGVSAPRSM